MNKIKQGSLTTKQRRLMECLGHDEVSGRDLRRRYRDRWPGIWSVLTMRYGSFYLTMQKLVDAGAVTARDVIQAMEHDGGKVQIRVRMFRKI